MAEVLKMNKIQNVERVCSTTHIYCCLTYHDNNPCTFVVLVAISLNVCVNETKFKIHSSCTVVLCELTKPNSC